MPFRCSLTCCRAVQNRAAKVTFHRLPGEAKRRQRRDWIRIVRLVNGEAWEPAVGTRICGRHFVTGKPSKRPFDLDFIPRKNLFKTEVLLITRGKGQQAEAIVASTPISIDDKPVTSSAIQEQKVAGSESGTCINKETTDSCGSSGSDGNTEELITGDLPDLTMDVSSRCKYIKKEPVDTDFPAAAENSSSDSTMDGIPCCTLIKEEPVDIDFSALAENPLGTLEFTSESASDTTTFGDVHHIKQEPYDSYDSSPSSGSASSAEQSKPVAGINCQLTGVKPEPVDHTTLQECHQIHKNHSQRPDTLPKQATPVSLKCGMCSSAFLVSSTLTAHLNIGARVLMCSSCFPPFVGQQRPTRHVIHEARKSFSRDLRSVKSQASVHHSPSTKLKVHVETVGAPHKCARCPATFIRRCDLIHHMRTHTIGNLFRCEFCPALYGTSVQLERHLSKHMAD